MMSSRALSKPMRREELLAGGANQAPLLPAFWQSSGHGLASSCCWKVILLQNILFVPGRWTHAPRDATASCLESNKVLNILYLPTFPRNCWQSVTSFSIGHGALTAVRSWADALLNNYGRNFFLFFRPEHLGLEVLSLPV